MRMDLSLKSLEEAVSIRRKIDILERSLASLFSAASGSTAKSGKRRMSAATRAKIAAAARARWAKQKRGKGAGRTLTVRTKGGITAAGRKRLSQLMKARWAARRKAMGRGLA
jgi:hypothetical protein